MLRTKDAGQRKLRPSRSESKRLEKEVRLLAHALSSSSECITIADQHDRLLFVNDAFVKTYGWAREELIGQTIEKVRSSRNDPAFTASILPATLAGGWQGELWNRRKDGSEFPIRLSTSVIRDDKGAAIATVSVAIDITDQKRSEAALEEARRAAEAASEAKSQFLANMSHEIRTPMNGILGMASLLIDTDLTPSQREMADAVRTSTESLLSIINDILDFSRIEAGQMRVERAPFDLSAALEDIVKLLTPRAKTAGIRLMLWYDPDAPRRFLGDAGRIRQVFLNLVGNAIKFTEEGRVLVSVECSGLTESAATMLMRVEDTGVGIPADKLPLLFRKFSQVDSSAARRHEGAGLGLAITKSLVELMGGSVNVDSRVNKGSSFTVTLPLAMSYESLDARSAPVRGTAGLPVAFAGRRALLVEDNPINQRVGLRLLEKLGFDVALAANGREAIHSVEQTVFDVVLMDCQMPEMDGLEAARRIRSSEGAGRRTPIVALTAHALESDQRACIAAGMDGYISKPVRPEELSRLLEGILPRAQAPAASSGSD